MRRLITILCIVLAGWMISTAHSADKRVVIDNLTADSTMLLIDFHAEGLIDARVKERLRSGFTTIFEYQIQLWRRKSFIFNQLVAENFCRMKLTFDNWDKRYRIITAAEDRKTTSIEKAKEMCLAVQGFGLTPLEKLHDATEYSVTVQLLIKPISVENLEEIERALRGEQISANNPQNDKPEAAPDAQNRFLKFILAFTGLGDKVLSSPRLNFLLAPNRQIQFNE
jgi:hypothetical protein